MFTHPIKPGRDYSGCFYSHVFHPGPFLHHTNGFHSGTGNHLLPYIENNTKRYLFMDIIHKCYALPQHLKGQKREIHSRELAD